MTRPATSRIDKLLASMRYSSRAVIARTARSGVIMLDGVALRDATGRKADLRCDCKPRMLHRSEPTLNQTLFWVDRYRTEGRLEPECTNLCIAAHTCFQCKKVWQAIETVKKRGPTFMISASNEAL